ncbi:ECF RNA polymerase sigma factor SigG [Lentzea sp. NBRC 105346]|uniref:RNA polymerase subunit sigma-70 n=1 Tax=Lentzea sp. NBRC 105346 TaxID=3032205 RepID=UPI0024A34ECE|nr:RNA polymerase subunit sigma-70 [Lentzea sp. NBRC 105346]GLZ31817.1 ECF RNA polymerase sigma factor SigG [Lentzea sp. NBRC 105346]
MADRNGEFDEWVSAHRHELLVHCYRMLGSLTDAEDVLQETLLAAWRGLDGFAGRSSPRTWLYRIATNRCLNFVRRLPPEPVPPFEPPPPTRRNEVVWLQPLPDPDTWSSSRESVELAFIVALQHLPPRQTAALVLRDVLDFSAAEVASMLDTSETAVKGLLQRARAALRYRPTPVSADPDLVQRFASAFMANDIPRVVDLLTDDAWLAMPPAPHEYHGRAAIAAFLRARGNRPLRLVPARANGQPAFGCYLEDSPAGVLVLTMASGGVAGVTRFLDVDPDRYLVYAD